MTNNKICIKKYYYEIITLKWEVMLDMENKKANKRNNPDFRENKFTQEGTIVEPDKAATHPPSLNEVPKETNPQ